MLVNFVCDRLMHWQPVKLVAQLGGAGRPQSLTYSPGLRILRYLQSIHFAGIACHFRCNFVFGRKSDPAFGITYCFGRN